MFTQPWPAHIQHWHGHLRTCGLVNLLKGLIDHLLHRLEGILGGRILLGESRQCFEDLQTREAFQGLLVETKEGVQECPLQQPSVSAHQDLVETYDVLIVTARSMAGDAHKGPLTQLPKV